MMQEENTSGNFKTCSPSALHVLLPTDFFLPKMVLVRDLSRGFFSGTGDLAVRPGRSVLSSAYLGL